MDRAKHDMYERKKQKQGRKEEREEINRRVTRNLTANIGRDQQETIRALGRRGTSEGGRWPLRLGRLFHHLGGVRPRKGTAGRNRVVDEHFPLRDAHSDARGGAARYFSRRGGEGGKKKVQAGGRGSVETVSLLLIPNWGRKKNEKRRTDESGEGFLFTAPQEKKTVGPKEGNVRRLKTRVKIPTTGKRADARRRERREREYSTLGFLS